jgi:hypothetical protein
MKVTVEVPNGPKAWKQFTTTAAVSRHGNYFFKHDGKPFVFRDLKHGCKVVTTNDQGKWVVCGRISHGTVFLGGPRDQSSAEYNRTPEGIAESRKLWQAYRSNVGLWTN